MIELPIEKKSIEELLKETIELLENTVEMTEEQEIEDDAEGGYYQDEDD